MLEARKCPNCGSGNINDNLKCLHCDSQLQEKDDGSLILIGTSLHKCSKCGNIIGNDETFCGKCGEKQFYECPICQNQHHTSMKFLPKGPGRV